MANIIKQTVFQIGNEDGGIPERMIVQCVDEDGNDFQTINNYDDLTDEQKQVFDDFKTLSQNLIS